MDENIVKAQVEQLVEKVKELVNKGNVSRIVLKRNGETIVNLPLNAGIVGTIVGIAAGPWALLASALVTYGLDIRIELVKTDGEIVEVNAELLGEKVDDLGDVVSEKIHEVKDKLSNASSVLF